MSMNQTPPPDIVSLVSALLISLMSGFISIAQRIVRGQKASLLWVSSEYTAAILCGWLAWDAYSVMSQYLPEQITLMMFVAAAAHFGGRTFQGVENYMYEKFGINFDGTKEK